MEAIAGFISWIIIANFLRSYLQLPVVISGGLVWAIAWLAQRIIQQILKEQLSPRDLDNIQFLNGPGLETLREIHCRTNPQDEACFHHQKFK